VELAAYSGEAVKPEWPAHIMDGGVLVATSSLFDYVPAPVGIIALAIASGICGWYLATE
jgi:hypothetical protein